MEENRTRHVTADEWRLMVAADPVLQIFQRISANVRNRRLNPPAIGHDNYLQAVDEARGEEYEKYLKEKLGCDSYVIHLDGPPKVF